MIAQLEPDLLTECSMPAQKMFALFFVQLSKNEEGIRDNSARGVSPALCGLRGTMPELVVNAGGRLWYQSLNNITRETVAMARDVYVIVTV